MSATTLNPFDIVSLVLYSILTLIMTSFLLFYFTNKSKPSLQWYSYLTLGITYSVCVYCIFVLGVDVGHGLKESGRHHVGTEATDADAPIGLVVLWYVLFWTIQLLAWIVIPVIQGYVSSGEITWIRKLGHSLLTNFVSYVVLGLIGVGLFIILIVYFSVKGKGTTSVGDFFQCLYSFIVGCSNAFAIVILIFLLSYGLADIPKFLWNLGDYRRRLCYHEFKAALMFEKLLAAQSHLIGLLSIVRVLDASVPPNHALRKFVDVALGNCEKELDELVMRTNSRTVREEKYQSVRAMVRLNRNVKAAVRQYNCLIFQWEQLTKKAFFLQDVLQSVNRDEIRSPFREQNGERKEGGCWSCLRRTEWVWHHRIAFVFWRVLAVVFVIIGLFLIWCEIAILVQTIASQFSDTLNLSPISLLAHAWGQAEFVNQMLCVFLLASITGICLWGLLRFRLFSYYRLVPHHSDAASLLFTLVFLCRVIFGILLNFMQILHASRKEGIAYFTIMTTLDGLKIVEFGKWFVALFPIVIPVLALLFFFEVFARIGQLCGIARFTFEKTFFIQYDLILDGRDILKRERGIALRELERARESASRAAAEGGEGEGGGTRRSFDDVAPEETDFEEYYQPNLFQRCQSCLEAEKLPGRKRERQSLLGGGQIQEGEDPLETSRFSSYNDM